MLNCFGDLRARKHSEMKGMSEFEPISKFKIKFETVHALPLASCYMEMQVNERENEFSKALLYINMKASRSPEPRSRP